MGAKLGVAVLYILIGGAAFSQNRDSKYDPCVPVASDVDCAGGKGDEPVYVTGPIFIIGE